MASRDSGASDERVQLGSETPGQVEEQSGLDCLAGRVDACNTIRNGEEDTKDIDGRSSKVNTEVTVEKQVGNERKSGDPEVVRSNK